MLTIGERFDLIYQHLRKRLEALPSADLSKFFSVPKSTLSQIRNGVSKPSADVLIRLSTLHPEYNMNWLLTGQGTMLLDEIPATNAEVVALQAKIEEITQERKQLYRTLSNQNEQIDELRDKLDACEKKQGLARSVA